MDGEMMAGGGGAEMEIDAEMESDAETRIDIGTLMNAPNLEPYIDDDVKARIVRQVLDGLEKDTASNRDRFDDIDKALEGTRPAHRRTAKTYPHDRASNVHYPLIMSAALYYNARAYPAILPAGDIVHAKVQGRDIQGLKATRGRRVADWLTYDLRVRQPNWEADTDRLLLQLPMVGHLYRKSYWDPSVNRTASELCGPKRVVVNDGVTSLEKAPRISDCLTMSPDELETAFRMQTHTPFEWQKDPSDPMAEVKLVEQHFRFDLDQDGYPEPLIALVHPDTHTLVRLTGGFTPKNVQLGADNGVLAIGKTPFFTDYKFMPNFEGGYHGIGFARLLGDISETINTLLNQINDSGHMASTGAGFIGAQNFRVKGGSMVLKPNEFRQMNFTGDDIRKGIVQMQFPGPSSVMFQVLGLMIEMGRELSATKDVMTGDVQREQPATTTLAMIEQGMTLFTASYKRIYLALAREYAFVAELNQQLDRDTYAKFLDIALDEGTLPDPAVDFDPADMDIRPVADPRAVTGTQHMVRAQLVREMAAEGLLDKGQATLRILEAAAIDDPQDLLPQQTPADKLMMGAQLDMMISEVARRKADVQLVAAKVKSELAKAAKDVAAAEGTEGASGDLDSLLEDLEKQMEVLNVRQGQLAGMAGAPGDPSGAGNPDGREPEGGTGDPGRRLARPIGAGILSRAREGIPISAE